LVSYTFAALPGTSEVDYRALGKDGEVLFSGVERG
jgi:hypothetical protein